MRLMGRAYNTYGDYVVVATEDDLWTISQALKEYAAAHRTPEKNPTKTSRRLNSLANKISDWIFAKEKQ